MQLDTNMMEGNEMVVEHLRDLHRNLNSIEHMIYVSCKFTRTTEMLKKVMSAILKGYENFFDVAYNVCSITSGTAGSETVFNKIAVLKEYFLNSGVEIDLADYFLIKRLLLSEFECVGEYRKNLALIAYIDGEEFIINVSKLLEFYNKLKSISNDLNSIKKLSN